jgi:hypothetical protein
MSATRFTVTDPSQLDHAVKPLTGKVAQQIGQGAAERTPRRTGRLAAGWRVQATGAVGWAVTNDVPYGRFVEYGSIHNRAVAMLGSATAQARRTYGR